ncbi:hypothetical protein [Actinomadura violacea]|uniref:Translation initiation factor IF-2 n=1 Tax=Actinomadura violacea TaxID=2819934 RepID=A0ABS3RIS9_9ACTN|nr:hypothetical protein [Actinomadura violacea]MBO2456248.1 hypothetical protein [Actinomadura violacea]
MLVAGDPCFDRLAASVPWRDRYRAALGLRGGQRLVVATSTWGEGSLVGRRPELMARLLAELPADEYRVAAVIHPNAWHEPGPWQLRAWLADCRRAGMLLIPPREGWRAALVASDAVVGDHGSVTLYAAALGRPVFLGAFPREGVAAGTAMAGLGEESAFLDDARIREQLGSAVSGSGAKVADAVFAEQGRSAEILRSAAYRLMRLDPPPRRVRVLPVPPPRPEPRRWEDGEVPALVAAVTVEVEPGRAVFTVERTPAEMADLRSAPPRGHRHLVVDDTEPDHRLRGLADLRIQRAGRGGAPVAGDPGTPVAETGADGSCRLRLPDGPVLVLRTAADVDPGVLASAVLAWTARGGAPDALPARLAVRIGTVVAPFTCDAAS